MTTNTTQDESEVVDSVAPDTGEAEEQIFAEEVGTLVFQSALMRYLQTIEDSEATAFESFVETHVMSDTFMDELCAEYPDFKNFLTDEMAAFIEEAKSLPL